MNATRRRLLALACAGLCGAAVPPAAPAPAAPSSFAGALQRSLPFALGVYGVGKRERRNDLDLERDGNVAHENDVLAARLGAGFMIDAQGHAVTAAHVLTGSERVIVKLADQRVVLAQKIGEDEDTDIALIRLPIHLPAPPLGRSAPLRTGDWVLAIGEPYGLNRSVAAGIVGGKDRHFAEDRDVLFIQSDLALNPGNSGGALLDAQGFIVGMNMRTMAGGFGSPGVSLSIPIEVVLQIAHELKASGTITRPRLGADFHDLSAPGAIARGRSYAHGALIHHVQHDSLAERAGLREGDIVVGMNGRAIGHSADFARALLAWRKVQGTRFTVYRDTGYLQLKID